jgi:hypothetical protein
LQRESERICGEWRAFATESSNGQPDIPGSRLPKGYSLFNIATTFHGAALNEPMFEPQPVVHPQFTPGMLVKYLVPDPVFMVLETCGLFPVPVVPCINVGNRHNGKMIVQSDFQGGSCLILRRLKGSGIPELAFNHQRNLTAYLDIGGDAEPLQRLICDFATGGLSGSCHQGEKIYAQ